jgi:hypothetical protein
MHKARGVDDLGFKTKLRLKLSTLQSTGLNTTTPRGSHSVIMQSLVCYDVTRHHLLWPNTYTDHNTTRIVHTGASTLRILYKQDATVTINNYTVPGHCGAPVHDIECTHITHKQYCQMYARARSVPANRNTIPSFRRLFHHRHTLLTGILGIMLCPL